jgi:hypothetical protein
MDSELEKWIAFTDKATAQFHQTQMNLEQEYQLSSFDRFEWNQETGNLNFIKNDSVALIAKFRFIGSVSFNLNTWLWGWANTSVKSNFTEDILKVKEFGKENNFNSLINDEWNADENDGWLMASISSYILNFKGVYKSPSSHGVSFLGITSIERL